MFIQVEWLMINDPNAIQHILQGQTTTYHLEESLREFLRVVTGIAFALTSFTLSSYLDFREGTHIC